MRALDVSHACVTEWPKTLGNGALDKRARFSRQERCVHFVGVAWQNGYILTE